MNFHFADEKIEMRKEVGQLFSKARTETEADKQEHPTGSQTPEPSCLICFSKSAVHSDTYLLFSRWGWECWSMYMLTFLRRLEGGQRGWINGL